MDGNSRRGHGSQDRTDRTGMDEFLGLSIGLTGFSGVVALLIGKEAIGEELLALCLIVIVVAGLWWGAQGLDELWRRLWDGRR